MRLFGKLGGALLVALAALAGNWLGGGLRAMASGAPPDEWRLMYTTGTGRTVLGLNLTLTNFLPALLLALLAGRPRTLFAFLSGALISALVGESYERSFATWLRGQRSDYAPEGARAL